MSICHFLEAEIRSSKMDATFRISLQYGVEAQNLHQPAIIGCVAALDFLGR